VDSHCAGDAVSSVLHRASAVEGSSWRVEFGLFSAKEDLQMTYGVTIVAEHDAPNMYVCAAGGVVALFVDGLVVPDFVVMQIVCPNCAVSEPYTASFSAHVRR